MDSPSIPAASGPMTHKLVHAFLQIEEIQISLLSRMVRIKILQPPHPRQQPILPRDGFCLEGQWKQPRVEKERKKRSTDTTRSDSLADHITRSDSLADHIYTVVKPSHCDSSDHGHQGLALPGSKTPRTRVSVQTKSSHTLMQTSGAEAGQHQPPSPPPPSGVCCEKLPT